MMKNPLELLEEDIRDNREKYKDEYTLYVSIEDFKIINKWIQEIAKHELVNTPITSQSLNKQVSFDGIIINIKIENKGMIFGTGEINDKYFNQLKNMFYNPEVYKSMKINSNKWLEKDNDRTT